MRWSSLLISPVGRHFLLHLDCVPEVLLPPLLSGGLDLAAAGVGAELAPSPAAAPSSLE